MESKNLAFVLGTSPVSANTGTVTQLIEAAVAAGHTASVFLFDEGLGHALRATSNRCSIKALQRLLGPACRILVCGNMAKSRGIEREGMHPEVQVGSLLDFEEMIGTADRVFFFAR